MENIYDIKHEKNLNFILPLKYRIRNDTGMIQKKKILTVIHLHYPDTVEFYLQYIANIPAYIDVLITFSDRKIKEIIQKSEVYQKLNCRMVEKQNRGRDISSFLVACRQDILQYEYICFLHDKKEKDVVYKKGTEKWVYSLWENMIGSEVYIHNILVTFDENQNLGLLVPPFLISGYYPMLYDFSVWYGNFTLVRQLAEKMGLQCDLDDTKSPVTLGTVFWARVSALRKLLEIEWNYEDFDEEPLKNDGTVSHAVERILAYVAQDMGFETGWVMTDRYMSGEFEYIQTVLQKAFRTLKDVTGIWKINEFDEYSRKTKELTAFVNEYERFYIYGAGVFGRRCLTMLKDESRGPEAFLVSRSSENVEKYHGIPVCAFDHTDLDERCGIVVAVSDQYRDEILKTIESRFPGFSNIYLL